MRRRLLLDALVLWAGVRVFALLFPGAETPSPLLPAPRTSLVIVAAAVFLCFVQVRRFKEIDLLRNLGVSLQGQLLLSFSLVAAMELAARILVSALLAKAGSG
jgi:hypothetical protein